MSGRSCGQLWAFGRASPRIGSDESSASSRPSATTSSHDRTVALLLRTGGLRVPRQFIAFLACALLLGCAASPRKTPAVARQDGGGKSYAYVVLGEEGRAIARVITHAPACPGITLDGGVVPMDVRARPETVALRPTASTAGQSKPSAFPVLVCEKAIPEGTREATVGGRTLPLPSSSVARVVVLGDSGCRIKAAEHIFQSCNEQHAWPFPVIAEAAARSHPDLVIHVGDFHYRENECPAGNVGCAGSPWGYGWDAWEADFFAPAEPLLAAAPWVVVRGNHESCHRAGQGWWRFLDPRPLTPHTDCNVAADDAIGDYSEPYAVPLGSTADADTQLVIFDSSRVAAVPIRPGDQMFENYHAQYERAFALAGNRAHTFFVNHHPVLGFTTNPFRPAAPDPGNQALQSVLAAVAPGIQFPTGVEALISGHVHLFQAVSFTSGQPPQFVAGNGGDWLAAALVSVQPGVSPAPGATVSTVTASNRFGFMTMERRAVAWQVTAWDRDSRAVTVCTVLARQMTCAPPSVP